MSGSRNEPTAVGAACCAVVAWSSAPLTVRGIHASVPTVAFWRMVVAVPAMSVAAHAVGGRLSRSTFRAAALPGLLFGSSLVLSYGSFQRTSIANATLIAAMLPAVVLLVAPRLLGERPNARLLGLSAVALAGVVLVVATAGNGAGADRVGDLMAVGNLVLWSTYFIMVKRARDAGVHAQSFLACVTVVAFVVVTPWALVTSDDLGGLDAKGWWLVVFLVLGSGLIGHGVMTWAQRHLDLTLASLITLLQPVLASIGAWAIYGQRLRALQLLGGAVVLVALAVLITDARPSARRTRVPAIAE